MGLCPKCGKEAKGVCLDCFLEKNPVELGKLKLSTCSCGKIRIYGKWGSTLDDVPKLVEKAIKSPFELKINNVVVEPYLLEKSLKLDLTVSGEYLGQEFKRKLNEEVPLVNEKCMNCTRRGSGYYEAILQLRTDIPDLEIDDSQIVKVMNMHKGIDYYLISNNYAKSLTGQLKRRGYKIKASKKIYGRIGGREVYRVSYSIKEKD